MIKQKPFVLWSIKRATFFGTPGNICLKIKLLDSLKGLFHNSFQKFLRRAHKNMNEYFIYHLFCNQIVI